MTTPARRRRRKAAENNYAPVRWDEDPNIPILFANQVFVRLQEDYILVTFGQAELPKELELTPETRTLLRAEGIHAKVVARLAVTPRKLAQIIEHLTTVHNRWLEIQQEQQRE